jgi:hypothetical protein
MKFMSASLIPRVDDDEILRPEVLTRPAEHPAYFARESICPDSVAKSPQIY